MKLHEAVHLVRSKKFKYFHTETSVFYGFDSRGEFYSKERDGSNSNKIGMETLKRSIQQNDSDGWQVS